MGNTLPSPRRRRRQTGPTGVPQLFGDQPFAQDEMQQRMQAIFLHGTNPDVAFLAQNTVQPSPPEMKETQTIKNDVNLIKESLTLVQNPDDPQKFRVHFTFDAVTECKIQLYFMAREVGATSASTLRYIPQVKVDGGFQSSESTTEATTFPAGLGQVYDSPEWLDLALYRQDLEDLTKNSEDCSNIIPVVIQIHQSNNATGTADNGASGDVQSQITLATLLVPADQDGETMYRISVLRQMILVEDEIYELQDIYGLESASASSSIASSRPSAAPSYSSSRVAPMDDGTGATNDATEAGAMMEVNQEHDDDEDLDDNSECVICLSEPRDTTILPCRHMCLCHGCAESIRSQTNMCPICRTKVDGLLHIKVKRKSHDM